MTSCDHHMTHIWWRQVSQSALDSLRWKSEQTVLQLFTQVSSLQGRCLPRVSVLHVDTLLLHLQHLHPVPFIITLGTAQHPFCNILHKAGSSGLLLSVGREGEREGGRDEEEGRGMTDKAREKAGCTWLYCALISFMSSSR